MAAFLLAFSALVSLQLRAAGQVISNATRYELDYPLLGYQGPAQHNCVARLQERIARGEVKLDYASSSAPGSGYLRSILDALGISVSSQVLVYSKTSLQTDFIDARTPRAIYFSDDCYVAWVQSSGIMEFVALDADLGVVFYTLDNRPQSSTGLSREGGRCLTCHDTYSMMGGGVPRVLAMSTPVQSPADTRGDVSATEVTDTTPVSERWGGWYVTGHAGTQTHLGNLPVRGDHSGVDLRDLRGRDLQTLAGYFDTGSYLTDRSDIAALLVFEHQSTVQNLIVRANFKMRSLAARPSTPIQEVMSGLMEPVLRALFFAGAAPLQDRIVGNSGFDQQFVARGSRDSKGRSLRDLDLKTKVFRYPLSYLVYSQEIESLPPGARDYLSRRIVEVLQGRDQSGLSAAITLQDRQATREILIATSPRFASLFASSHQP